MALIDNHPHAYPPIEESQSANVIDNVNEVEPPASILPQCIAALVATTGGLVMGSVIGWSGPALSLLVGNQTYHPIDNGIDFSVSESQGNWVASLMAAGALVGGPVGGVLVGRTGKKGTMMYDSLLFGIGYLLLASAQNVWMLFLGRFLCGLASGIVTVSAPTYVSETASPKVRGMLGSSFQLMVTVGILYVDIVGAVTSNVRWLSVSCIVLCVLWALLLLGIPESPGHLLFKKDYDGARRSLEFLRGHPYIETELSQVQMAIDQAARANFRFMDLLKAANLKPLVIALVLMFGQQFSGINAVLFYSVTIFEAAKTNMNSFVENAIVAGTQVLSTFLAAMLIDKLGRRLFLILSATIMITTLYCLGLYFWLTVHDTETASKVDFLPLASLCIFIFAFSIGFGPIPWLMMSELFSAEVRGLASSISSSFNWTMAFVITLSYGPISKAVGQASTFWTFAAFMASVLAFCTFVVPETKGRSLEEIQLLFNATPSADESQIMNDADTDSFADNVDVIVTNVEAEIDAEMRVARA